eukprot:GHVN01002933.1.p2 GENE.GHVN01002933.1~~GHVN01002933.1.p2  ORF type:complete len:101 (-),score=11.26 GHVN01002933.1:896-1198(-)
MAASKTLASFKSFLCHLTYLKLLSAHLACRTQLRAARCEFENLVVSDQSGSSIAAYPRSKTLDMGVSSLNYNGKVIRQPREIAEALASHYQSVSNPVLTC